MLVAAHQHAACPFSQSTRQRAVVPAWGKCGKPPAREDEAARRRRGVGTAASSGTDITGAEDEEGPALGTGGAGALGTDSTGANQALPWAQTAQAPARVPIRGLP